MTKNTSSVGRRLLFVSPSLRGGGAERVILWLAQECARAGFTVSLVTISDSSNDAYPVPDGVQRIALDMDAESQSPLDAIVGNYRRVAALKRSMQQLRPDLVISFQTTANIYAAVACLFSVRRQRVPLIISERTFTPAAPLGFAWRCLRRFIYPLATTVVVLSELNAKWLLDKRMAQSVKVIGNPVVYPLETFEPIKMPINHVDSSASVILAVGRLESVKGFDVLLHAFAQVCESFANWQLVIVGAGEVSGLQAQAARLGIADRVHLPGRAGNVGDWYARADVFVLSSRREGFPNALVEAMSHGLAVLAADCETGPADIIEHELNGLLVQQNDAVAMSAGLDRLLAEPALRTELGKAAVQVKTRFAPATVLDLWLQSIDNTMSAR